MRAGDNPTNQAEVAEVMREAEDSLAQEPDTSILAPVLSELALCSAP